MISIIITLLCNVILLSFFLDGLPGGTAAPTGNKPCDFSQYIKNGGDLYTPVPIDVVRSCLTSFPYDAKTGSAIIDSITKALTGYYVFLDSARDPPNPGNTYDGIDVVGELEALLKHDFRTDYDFSHNVTNILNQLKDAHTRFLSNCYRSFILVQGLDLYSVVDSNGQQSIKVWKDFLDDTNYDCDVLQIDGVPAIQAIKQYALENVGLVRDLGIRFNIALTALSVDGVSEFSNYFSRRIDLPPSNDIAYTLQCNGVQKNIVRTWSACGHTQAIDSATDPNSYWEQNCSPDIPSERVSSYRKLISRSTARKGPTSLTTDTICGMIESSPVKLNNGQLLLDLVTTKFFHLPEQNTGVMTMTEVEFSEDLIQGFQKFIDNGVKKVILDLTNNGGGRIDVAHLLNNLLFPQTDPFFDTDFRVSDLMRLSIQNSNQDVLTYPGIWLDPQTRQPFENATSFIGNNVYVRGGVSESYTSHFIDSDQSSSTINLPWQATDYAILTNGFCGSACSLIATHLAEENNVLTVSVGGFNNTPMAFASFTGGQVYALSFILNELQEIGLSDNPLAPSPLPIFADLSFAIREAYSRSNKDEVLEFSYRPATKRLYYDSNSARDPSALWVQVANILNSQ